jgi:hypothetical protein
MSWTQKTLKSKNEQDTGRNIMSAVPFTVAPNFYQPLAPTPAEAMDEDVSAAYFSLPANLQPGDRGYVPGLMTQENSRLFTSEKIRRVVTESLLFGNIPDVGLDSYLITNGETLGTNGLACGFAICTIGKTLLGTPVLGLCNTTGINSFNFVLEKLKKEMVLQGGAQAETIETYVVGGYWGSREFPEGSIAEEKVILALAEKEKIMGVSFNLAEADDENDSLSVVVTSAGIIVSNDLLFPNGAVDAGKGHWELS